MLDPTAFSLHDSLHSKCSRGPLSALETHLFADQTKKVWIESDGSTGWDRIERLISSKLSLCYTSPSGSKVVPVLDSDCQIVCSTVNIFSFDLSSTQHITVCDGTMHYLPPRVWGWIYHNTACAVSVVLGWLELGSYWTLQPTAQGVWLSGSQWIWVVVQAFLVLSDWREEKSILCASEDSIQISRYTLKKHEGWSLQVTSKKIIISGDWPVCDEAHVILSATAYLTFCLRPQNNTIVPGISHFWVPRFLRSWEIVACGFTLFTGVQPTSI